MKQPVEPQAEDCCNSGCNPCIFDVYEKQLQLYKLFVEHGHENPKLSQRKNAISQLEYTKFYVVKIIDLPNKHRLLQFRRDIAVADAPVVFWSAGDHFLFKYSTREYSCTRAYTPIKIEASKNKDYDFEILVKKYENGLVSTFLYDLKVMDVTNWRGPYGHYKLESNKFTRLIMVTQGTGIAPMYSIIKEILSDEENMSQIILFYCCKNLKSVLLRNELYLFKSYWNFSYKLYLGEILEDTMCKYQEPISYSKLNFKNIVDLSPFNKSDQFLLCGSDDFMQSYYKPLTNICVDKDNIVKF